MFAEMRYLRSLHSLVLRSSSPRLGCRHLSYSDFDPVPIQTVNPITEDDTDERLTYGRSKNAQGKSLVDTRKATPSAGFSRREVVKSKKKAESKITWVCQSCNHTEGQWWGTCHNCTGIGTFIRFSEGSKSTLIGTTSIAMQPLKLSNVVDGITKHQWRIQLSGVFGDEVARVLGGGLVPGSLILIGGDPGIGKSTLLLQIASIIAEGIDSGQPAPVLYVSGEESVEQIGSRADRMNIEADELYLFSSSDLKVILRNAQRLSPRAIIIDSIQTVYLDEASGSAGSLGQVKECTAKLLHFAKNTNVPVFLVGHVTKAGDIAGPRVLEHMVDAVLYMEGEDLSTYRLLRSVKNRFGSTDELGVFEMSQSGLEVVSNPSGIFLSQQDPESDVLAGLAVAVVMDGTRSFLIEVQALCAPGSTVSRHVNGVPAGRANMIIAVLIKQAGLQIQDNGIFLNVANGGVTLSETAGDLAIAASICSSFLESPIPQGVAFIGEIGLGGEVRTVPRMDKRISTLAKLGFKKCFVPRSVEKSLEALDLKEIEIIGCNNLKELIRAVFRRV